MKIGEVKANISLEKWYCEYTDNCVDKLQDLKRQGKITEEQAIALAVDTIVLTIKHGMIVQTVDVDTKKVVNFSTTVKKGINNA